jgi:flagellar assembly factor FliW
LLYNRSKKERKALIIETASWGSLELTDEQIFRFDKGIPGFEEFKKFALIVIDDGPFSYLQSVEDKNISFMLADPFVFYPNYEFELPDEEALELGINGQIFIRSMLTLQKPLEDSTVNLLAPLVLNPANGKAKQVVLHQTVYQTRHPLWRGINSSISAKEEGK